MSNATQITRSSQAAGLLRDNLAKLDHEECWGIFLGPRNHVLSVEMLTKGTLRTTPLDARTVVKRALLNNATAVILLHNHPTGSPLPSRQDIQETRKVRDACNLMDIQLVDHVVLAMNSYYSMNDEKRSNYSNE